MNYNAWYQSVYPRLSGHGLWLRGGELNTIPARRWDAHPFRILIARLSTFRDTADSFTHTLLYQIAASIDGVYPDLAWLPPPKDATVFDRDRVPWLLGATSKRPARAFTVVALSLSIVQELVNVPVMLTKSGIPLSQRERACDPDCPLVILGGASSLYTSALYSDDPMVDGIFVGEDAETVARLFVVCRDALAGGASRSDALERMCGVQGFFVPNTRPRTTVFHAPAMSSANLLTRGPVLTAPETIGTGHLQISEGCACFCSFCAESFSRKPYRELNAKELVVAALQAKKNMGVDDLDLYSFNFNMYRDLYALLAELAPLFPSIGLKSQRFDAIAYDHGLLEWLHALGKTSLTCGLEGISPRLRRYLHKSINEADLHKALRLILRAKVREIKIFLIATGLETDDDVTAWKEFVAFVRSAMLAIGRTPRVIFSITPLVRFPGTPLEFEDAPPLGVVSAIMGRCGQIARNAGFEFRTAATAAEYWLSQVLVRAPDGRVGAALAAAALHTGFVYYREIDERFIDAFSHELDRSGCVVSALLAGSPPSGRATQPWAGIDTGVTPAFLEQQWRCARAFVDTGYCAPIGGGEGTCRGCGACPDSNARALMTARRTRPCRMRPEEFRAVLKSAREREATVLCAVAVSAMAAGLPRKIVGAALGRALMRVEPGLVEGYRGYRGSQTIGTWQCDWIIGDDIITLAWDASCLPLLERVAADQDGVERVTEAMDGYGEFRGLINTHQSGNQEFIVDSPFVFAPDAYFHAAGLRHTLHKTGEGAYRYVFSAQSLKKGVLETLASVVTPDRTVVTLKPGPKFAVERFVREAFRMPHPDEWVRVGIRMVFSSARQ